MIGPSSACVSSILQSSVVDDSIQPSKGSVRAVMCHYWRINCRRFLRSVRVIDSPPELSQTRLKAVLNDYLLEGFDRARVHQQHYSMINRFLLVW